MVSRAPRIVTQVGKVVDIIPIMFECTRTHRSPEKCQREHGLDAEQHA